MYRTLVNNEAFRNVFYPGTYAASAQYGQWIDTRGYDEVTFVCGVDALDGNVLVEAVANSTQSSSGAAQVTDTAANEVEATFTNGTDENRLGLLTIHKKFLSSTQRYVTLRVTPAATQNFFAVAGLSNRFEAPVPNGTANGVAFSVGTA